MQHCRRGLVGPFTLAVCVLWLSKWSELKRLWDYSAIQLNTKKFLKTKNIKRQNCFTQSVNVSHSKTKWPINSTSTQWWNICRYICVFINLHRNPTCWNYVLPEWNQFHVMFRKQKNIVSKYFNGDHLVFNTFTRETAGYVHHLVICHRFWCWAGCVHWVYLRC